MAETAVTAAREQAAPCAPLWVLAAGLLALALASVPLFSTVLPPLLDYPNHLARFWLLAQGGSPYYAVHWAPLPNLAGDLIVPLLARMVPLAMAGKLFLAASFALTLIGAACLNRAAHGGWRLWPLLTVTLLYNRPFLWGFINYEFGLGLALCGAALWLAGEPGHRWWRLPAASIVAVLCFFAHIAAFGVYALLVAGIEALPALRHLRAGEWAALARRAATAAVQFAVPAAIVAGWWHPVAQGEFGYGHFWRKADLLFTVFDNYDRPFDIVCFLLLVVLIGGLAWRRQLGVAPRLMPAVALITAAYLLLPTQLMTGSGADRRVVVALFLVLIASAAPRFATWRAAMLTGAVIGAVLLARFAVIERVWLTADHAYRGDLAAIDALPHGIRLAVAYPPEAVNISAIPQTHVPTLAVWRRGAFVPTLFAFPEQQPVAVRPQFVVAAAAAEPALLWSALVDGDRAAQAPAWGALNRWDAIAFVDRRPFRVPPHRCLTPLLPQPTFQIYLLRRSGGCPAP